MDLNKNSNKSFFPKNCMKVTKCFARNLRNGMSQAKYKPRFYDNVTSNEIIFLSFLTTILCDKVGKKVIWQNSYKPLKRDIADQYDFGHRNY